MNGIFGRIRADRARRRSGDAGFTMIEVIVAMMVFSIVAIGVASGITNGLVLTRTSQAREAAVNIASQDIDNLRMLALGSASGVFGVTSTPAPVTSVVGGRTYSLSRVVDWITTTGGSGACGTGSGTLAYKSVVDTVTWPNGGLGTQSITMTTAVAPVSNINSDANGTIIIAIIGAGGAPESGVAITVTPTTGTGAAALPVQPSVTDSDGCSFGLDATPGTYTVTATETGGIDYQENAPASNSTVKVVAGQNTVVNFTYDQAAKFPLSYPSGATLATNMPVTFLQSTSLAPLFPNSPSSVQAFPYGNGYRVIAGTYAYSAAGGVTTCIDTDPTIWPVSSTGLVPPLPVTSSAGPGLTATSTSVPMGKATVTVASGNYITAVTAVGPTANGDPGCLLTQTLTFPKTTGTSQVIALPYGTWAIWTGNSSGKLTTNVYNKVTVATPSSVDTGTKSVTIDPRVSP